MPMHIAALRSSLKTKRLTTLKLCVVYLSEVKHEISWFIEILENFNQCLSKL